MSSVQLSCVRTFDLSDATLKHGVLLRARRQDYGFVSATVATHGMRSYSLLNTDKKVKGKHSYVNPYIEDSTPRIIKHSKRHMVI